MQLFAQLFVLRPTLTPHHPRFPASLTHGKRWAGLAKRWGSTWISCRPMDTSRALSTGYKHRSIMMDAPRKILIRLWSGSQCKIKPLPLANICHTAATPSSCSPCCDLSTNSAVDPHLQRDTRPEAFSSKAAALAVDDGKTHLLARLACKPSLS